MKKIFILLFTLGFFSSSPLHAETSWKEIRTVIFTPEKGKDAYLLQPDQEITKSVRLGQQAVPTRKSLRVVGGLQMPVPFEERGEEMFRRAEYLIDDNLDSIIRKQDRYSLYFKGENDPFERYAYYRVSGSLLQPGELTVKIPVVKKQGLSVSPEGDFGLEIGLYYPKAGRAADDIYDRPDSVLYLPIPEGTGKQQSVSATFQLDCPVACALIRIGGIHFSGACWVEAPRLTQGKKSVCSIPFTKFAQKTDPFNYWVGVNLATRSWPMWKLEFNGKCIFQGNRFDRASNVADFYIPLPDSLQGVGELKLSLLKEPHRAAFPYELQRLEVIEEYARDYEVIAVPKYVAKDSDFGVLVETNRPHVKLQVKVAGAALEEQSYQFEKTGLHVVELRSGKAGQPILLSFDDGNRREEAQVLQVIDKEVESIYLSSGDEIHIDKQYVPYDYFFKWYFNQRIGNWYQFRPSYQWSGFRIADPEIIRHYTQLLSQMKVPYAWQVEGRTLASSRINPSLETLASPLFRGKQAHENDGGYYYWQHFKYQGLFSDMAARARPFGGIFAKHRPIYTDHGTFIHYDTQGINDMAEGARQFVANLRYSKGESTRHTGPSTMFRYLYQAGYEWLGAEQMYGPEEIIISALRGASRAYSRPLFGSLHAMQWGSFPFTDPKHALRHYMSLAVAYMHGSSHINTEEALWTDEYAHDRYSESGKAHLFSQHQILDYIETHTRRGDLQSRIAVIQGRNDAWKSFVRGSVWSQEGEKWKFNQACESFDLLRVFYPENEVDACGPEGWFTSTPYGPVDLLPVEAPQDVMDRYKLMLFLGWNTYDENDFQRIKQYVFDGGTLLLSAAHLNAELQPDQPVQFPDNDRVIREMLGEQYRSMSGKNEIPYGNGRIIYFATPDYPIASSLVAEYEKTMHALAASSIEEESGKGWIASSPHVGFTVWDQGDHRTILLLDTDWQSNKEEVQAVFCYAGKKFTVPVRRYRMENIHCSAGLAVHPFANTTDVLSIQPTSNGWNVQMQTTGEDQIRCMHAVSGKEQTIDLKGAGIHSVFVTN